MRKLLEEISVIPGVTGSCIFDKKDGPLCQDLHPTLSKELLQTVGIHLVRLIQMGSMAGLDIQSSHFRFDKYAVVGMPLETGAVLLTICEAQANCSLVATTAAMLAADMREELRRGAATPVSEELEEVVAAEEVTMVLDETDDADMLSLYEEVEQALAGAIGPVAGVVLQDYLSKWKQAGPAIPARLADLAKMLEEEIGDDELAKDFSEKIKTIL
jgi:hypothetical protein